MGWDSSPQDKGIDTEPDKNVSNKKETRKARADWMSKRKKMLGPLEARVKKIEEDIERSETVQKKLTEKMTEAVSIQDSGNIQKTSKDLHGNRERIEILYADLENAMNKYEDEKIAFKRDHGEQV